MINFNESCSLSGQLFYIVKRRGVAVEESRERNMIMTLGRVAIARLFKGLSGGHGFYVGVGDGGEPPSPDQTALSNQYLVRASPIDFARAVVSEGITSWEPCEEQTTSLRFAFEFGGRDANGLGIKEFGLLTSDYTLFARRARGSGKPIEKDRDLSIEGYWVIRF